MLNQNLSAQELKELQCTINGIKIALSIPIQMEIEAKKAVQDDLASRGIFNRISDSINRTFRR